MEDIRLPEETAEDRVRAATEFLDPSMSVPVQFCLNRKLLTFF